MHPISKDVTGIHLPRLHTMLKNPYQKYAILLILAFAGSFAGGQIITIAGNGFDALATNITLDGAPCTLTSTPTATQIECETPSNQGMCWTVIL